MHQVLGNLLANALRYTPSGGRVSLSALGEGDRVLLQVRDDGLGIDPEILPYLFERFYRGEKSRTGDHGETGLGLAIARSIVQAHGGDLTAESLGRGQGSTFTISLPIEP
jgi:signal transduction histidine kinase